MAVLTVACLLCHCSPWFTLSVVIGTQAIRALWLYLKAHQASRDVKVFEHQAHDILKELAKAHPATE